MPSTAPCMSAVPFIVTPGTVIHCPLPSLIIRPVVLIRLANPPTTLKNASIDSVRLLALVSLYTLGLGINFSGTMYSWRGLARTHSFNCFRELVSVTEKSQLYIEYLLFVSFILMMLVDYLPEWLKE